jgi:hypothetical protein
MLRKLSTSRDVKQVGPAARNTPTTRIFPTEDAL